MSVTLGGGSPMSLRPTRSCRRAVEGDRAKIRESHAANARSGCARLRGSPGRGCPRRLAEAITSHRPMPRARQAARAAPHNRAPCSSSPIAAPEQAPELVGRMRIITPRRERRVAGQAAENEQPRIGPGDRRQSGFDAHQETPTARRRENERPPRRPLLGQLQLCPRRRQPGAQPARRLSAAPGRAGARLFADGRASRLPADRRPRRAFPPVPIPGPLRISACRLRSRRGSGATSKQFNPNVVHVSSPDIVGHRAVTWARRRKIAAVASVHTRFDTYLAYYHLQALEPLVARDHAALLPSLRSRARAGRIDRRDPSRAADEPRHRDLGPRHRPRAVQPRAPRHGVAPLARHRRRRDGHRLPWPGRHGKGPRRLCRRDPRLRDASASSIACWSSARGRRGRGSSSSCRDAIFIGQQTGADLARALASADVFLNPSITEAFGNVTLEAMACALAGDRGRGDRRDQPRPIRASPERWSTAPSPTSSPTRSQLMRAIPSFAAATAKRGSRSPRRWTGTRSTRR